ncbi:3'-5' exonuclease [Streptosporangium saharense]|uniref:DNA polymerase III epsilon subunit-like protein n=1 Tax=Streptosporangium saharense TaxID=1706840 RepID=A0A7W7QWA4_9ACTN|nr:3'-5' exonuclease [Streptosporangium saharense]MBB4920961.1 DNA polymerase III epsilon subunit-like protein [Streptosporangium saharense]
MQRDAVLRLGDDGLPVYRAGAAPVELATRRQLREEGLSAAGLAPAAWLHYSVMHGICALYQRAAARPVRPLTPRQHAALAAGRALAGTALCSRCRAQRGPVEKGRRVLCAECEQAEVDARLAREAAADAALERRLADDRDTAAAWARAALADPTAVILDTETTGLDGAYAVSLAVLSVTGETLLDTLLDPQVSIPADATSIHGITDADVSGAPTFGEILEQLTRAVHGRRVIIYNKAFDVGVLRRELRRHHGGRYPDAERETVTWLHGAQQWECAMEAYARWCGTWSDYWRDYTWQPLNGGHTALGDCRAVLRRLQQMAAPHPSSLTTRSA